MQHESAERPDADGPAQARELELELVGAVLHVRRAQRRDALRARHRDDHQRAGRALIQRLFGREIAKLVAVHRAPKLLGALELGLIVAHDSQLDASTRTVTARSHCVSAIAVEARSRAAERTMTADDGPVHGRTSRSRRADRRARIVGRGERGVGRQEEHSALHGGSRGEGHQLASVERLALVRAEAIEHHLPRGLSRARKQRLAVVHLRRVREKHGRVCPMLNKSGRMSKRVSAKSNCDEVITAPSSNIFANAELARCAG